MKPALFEVNLTWTLLCLRRLTCYLEPKWSKKGWFESIAPLKEWPLVAMSASADVIPFKQCHLCFAMAK